MRFILPISVLVLAVDAKKSAIRGGHKVDVDADVDGSEPKPLAEVNLLEDAQVEFDNADDDNNAIGLDLDQDMNSLFIDLHDDPDDNEIRRLEAAVTGAGTCPVSIVARSSTNLDVFAAGLDGSVYTGWWSQDSEQGWGGWNRIEGIEVAPCAPISVISRSIGKLDIFAVNTDHYVMTAAWEEGRDINWRGWWQVGNTKTTLHAPISVVSRSQDKLDLFMADLHGNVYTAAWEPGWSSFHGWWKVLNIQAPPGAPVGAVSRSADKLDIFVVDDDGQVKTAAWEPHHGWGGWWRIGGLVTIPRSPVSAVSRSSDYLDIFVTDANGRVVTAAWRPSLGSWHGWWTIGSFETKKRSPVTPVSRSNGKLDIFAVALNGLVSTAAWEPDGREWRGWWPVLHLQNEPGTAIGVVSRTNDWLDVVATGPGGRVYTAAWAPSFHDGWRGWWPIASMVTGLTDPRVNQWSKVGVAFESEKTAHSDEAQGLITDGNAWYLTSNGNKQIRKYGANWSLLASKTILSGSAHVGAPGYFDGKVYVPIQNPYAVWTANADLSDGESHSISSDEKGSDRFAWCDVNPLNGRLYTAEFDHYNNNPGILYAYDRDTFRRRPEDDIPLGSTPIHFDRIQGGVFTRTGRVLLARHGPNGVFAFSAITGASMGAKHLGDFGSTGSEVESVTVRPWQFGGTRADVHILELDNDWPFKDDCYLHSYSVPDPANL